MKKGLIAFSLFFILLNGKSQKIALLSQDFKKPILYTDSVTIGQITGGYFAVGINDFDTCVSEFKNNPNAVTAKRSIFDLFFI